MHACKDCGAENCDGECNTEWWTQSGDLADTIECQECCQGYDHEVSWNCPAVTTTSAPGILTCFFSGEMSFLVFFFLNFGQFQNYKKRFKLKKKSFLPNFGGRSK